MFCNLILSDLENKFWLGKEYFGIRSVIILNVKSDLIKAVASTVVIGNFVSRKHFLVSSAVAIGCPEQIFLIV